MTASPDTEPGAAGQDSEASDDRADTRTAYDVGYGKPPKEHRFKPGQSGNPSGGRGLRRKPSKADQLVDHILDIANANVTMREGERSRKIPAIRGIMLIIRNQALAGSLRAAREFTGFVEKAQAIKARQAAAIFATAAELKIAGQKLINERTAVGRTDISDIWPHPDDIHIHPSGFVEIVGPQTPEEKRTFDNAVIARDVLEKQRDELAARLPRSRGASRAKIKKAIAICENTLERFADLPRRPGWTKMPEKEEEEEEAD